MYGTKLNLIFYYIFARPYSAFNLKVVSLTFQLEPLFEFTGALHLMF